MKLKIPKFQGQGLGEYSLTIALIAVAGISALLLFGNNLQGIITGYAEQMSSKPAMTQNPTDTTFIANAGASPSASQTASQTSSEMDNTTTGLSIKLANGKTLSLPDYPNSIQSDVETNGANGTTELLASQLSLLSSQLLASGDITEEQSNQLHALANQGHAIAAIESTIATVILANNNASNPQNIDTLKFPHNGKDYTSGGIANLIGQPKDSNNQPIDGMEIKKLKQLLSNAKNTGALNDPNVEQLVMSLTGNITDIANKTEMAIDASHLKQRLPDKHNFIIAAHTTRGNSNTICKAGGSGKGNCDK